MDAFKKVISLLAERLKKSGSAILFGSHERIPIRSEGFASVEGQVAKRIVFVDAGNGEVLSGPNVVLSFVRLCSIWYEKNVRVERDVDEFLLMVIAYQKGLDLGFEARLLSPAGDELRSWNFDASDPVLSWGGRRAEPSAVVGYVRKLLEFERVAAAIPRLEAGDIIVRDGDLEAQGALLEASKSGIRTAAQNKSVIVLGLAKTSRLCTDSGNSALFALRQVAPQGAWSYYVGSDLAFVRLHQKAKYVFRCDVFSHDRASLKEAFAALAANGNDPSFLGYPYGLMDADKTAQVTKEEAAQLRLRFAVQSKEEFAGLEFALNAHDILNTF